VPVLEYRFEADSLAYRWTNCVTGFDMPVKVSPLGDAAFFITPGTQWYKVRCAGRELKVDRNFYVTVKEVK